MSTPTDGSPTDLVEPFRSAVRDFAQASTRDERVTSLDRVAFAAAALGAQPFAEADLAFDLRLNLTSRQEAELLFAVARGLGADLAPESSPLHEEGRSLEEEFGELFATFAAEVPPPAGRSTNGGEGLLALLRESTSTLPREEGIAALRASPAVRAAAPLGDRMAAFGVGPLTLLTAGQAVGRLLQLAEREGKLATGWTVEMDERGRLGAGWDGDPSDALDLIQEMCKVPSGTASALLRWLVAASEKSLFLFEECRARVRAGYDSNETRKVSISSMSASDLEADLSDPLHAWDPIAQESHFPIPEPA